MNLIDYIKINGSFSFNDLPFNEVDNVIFCQVSYVCFENIINDNKSHTIEELSKIYFSKYSDNDVKKDKSLIGKSPFVLKEMAKTHRYKNIIMHHFKHSSSKTLTHQFAAMQYSLDDGTTYVCFRGTDDSILGWKEDFQMAYKMIDGYKYAKKYINRYCSPFKKYRVGGHSKGGALALYGSCNCFSFIRNNIIEVYSNDGPGIRKEFIKNNLERIADRYIKIVPEDDIIGIIFDDDFKHRVVLADTKGIFQHNMLSWQIKDNCFKKAKSLSTSSKKLREKFNEYIYNTSQVEIVKVSNTLFDFLDVINIEKVSDLFKIKIGNLPGMIKAFPNIDESTGQIVLNIVLIFLESHLPTISFTSDKINMKKKKK